MKIKEKIVSYSLLRVLACFSVIWHHMMNNKYGDIFDVSQRNVFIVIDNLLLCCNGLFFMLSGKFALENYDGNIKRFYKNKLKKIGLPILIASFYFYVRKYGIALSSNYALSFGKEFVGNSIVSYFWFVYTLIGFYLFVPFFSKMVMNLSNSTRMLFLLINTSYIILINLGQIFEFPVSLNGYPFFKWMTYCFLGYLIDNIKISKKYEVLIIWLGIISVVISNYMMLFFPGKNPSIYDFCLSRILMCGALYIFITRYFNNIPNKMKSGFLFVGKYTFFIYIVHGVSESIVLQNLYAYVNVGNVVIATFLASVVSLAISLVISIIIDRIFYKIIPEAISGIFEKQKYLFR